MMYFFVSALLILICGCATRRTQVSVGSKNFTEQVILGEIIAQHLERRLKSEVDRKLNLGGTMVVHEALIGNQIDVYPEYTGTAMVAILRLDLPNDSDLIRDRVRAMYRSKWDLEWMDPLGFNNSFAMAVRSDDALKAGLKNLSQAEDMPWRLGVGYEFETRRDGLAALNTTYDIPWKGSPFTMDLGLLYRALDRKQVDMVAGSATDAMLREDRYAVLQDDRKAFPPYEAALVVRRDAFGKYPALRGALEELSGKFDEKMMRSLNYEVDVRKAAVSEVASAFLRSAGLQ